MASQRLVEFRQSGTVTVATFTQDEIFEEEEIQVVGEELQRRFGLPYWQFALTATDANRFAIRIAREITQRSKILVYNYCYHGTVDESFASLRDGVVGPRRGNIGPPVNPADTEAIFLSRTRARYRREVRPSDIKSAMAS